MKAMQRSGFGPCFCLLSVVAMAHPARLAAQALEPAPLPDNAPESYIIRQIWVLRESTEIDRQSKLVRMIEYVDALLERYPDSYFRDESLILKLTSLSALARDDDAYLRQFLSLTERLSKEHPTGRLVSENAFYAIQAFVLGARAEEMPEERRLLGTRERYEAFLEDHPNSHRAPTIMASLVRNLIAGDKVEEAEKWVKKLRQKHPDRSATRRAEGELLRAGAVGRRFRFEHTTADGKTLNTGDYSGKVIVVHFWSSQSDDSMKGAVQLAGLHEQFKNKGLQLVGVNIDRDRQGADQALEKHKMPWPQFFDGGGFAGELVVKSGVVGTPTYFVIDRDGVLRSTDPGDKLPELIKELLAKPVRPAAGKKRPKGEQEAAREKGTP